MTDATADRTRAGAALYSKLFLAVYDWLALGYNCRFLWRCPSYHMLELYNRYVSDNHLDIGVGTGYFIDNCRFPSPSPRLALMDLNPNSLATATKRLARYSPEVYQRNALEPFNLDARPFDSVGMMNLLHCLPGDMDTKGAVFENARAVLNPGGVVFGSTILGRGVTPSRYAAWWLRKVNSRGIMTNQDDDLEGLRASLRRHFPESHAEVIGLEALFWART